MRRESKEIIKLTAKQVLYSMFDIPVALFGSFDKGNVYRKSVRGYFKERQIDKINFKQKIYYLKKAGLINSFVENKEKFIELTEKGFDKIIWNNIGNDLRTEKWDGLWRVIIFDVPEKKKATREIIREKLKEIGFMEIQKSVFVFPFECWEHISAICYYCSAEKYIKYMIAEIIQGESEIIDKFLEKKILNNTDLKVTK
ncbi:MAG: hypothetical protein WC107_06475 [Patescibacteria group bacterium]